MTNKRKFDSLIQIKKVFGKTKWCPTSTYEEDYMLVLPKIKSTHFIAKFKMILNTSKRIN